MLSTESDYGLYQQFVQEIITDAVDYVGWSTLTNHTLENADHNKSLLRASVLGFAVHVQLPSVIEQAIEIWTNYKNNGTAIAPDDRQAVYCAALHYGGAE